MTNDAYSMYLDDERSPKTKDREWVVVRSFDEAVACVIANGIPLYCSFDHDLGQEESGYDFAKWLVEKDLNGEFHFPDDFEFNVHSANPVGARNIEEYLNNYLRIKRVDI